MENKHVGNKILHFPLTRIIIGIITIIVISGLSEYLIGELLNLSSITKEINDLITGILSAALAIISYILLYRTYEKRKISEFSTDRLGKNLVYGFLLGAILQSLTILIIYLNGGYSVVAVNSLLFVVPALTMAFSSAIIEEILFRGVLYRIIEEKLGSYVALLISAFIFGALHFANPNSSVIAALGLAIQAGLLLASAYLYARNLWFPIALHFAWNFMQSGIFGANVSGITIEKSLLSSQIQGAEWYTGGAFGPEGSIQATLFCLVATIVLLVLSHKQNRIIKPYWVK